MRLQLVGLFSDKLSLYVSEINDKIAIRIKWFLIFCCVVISLNRYVIFFDKKFRNFISRENEGNQSSKITLMSILQSRETLVLSTMTWIKNILRQLPTSVAIQKYWQHIWVRNSQKILARLLLSSLKRFVFAIMTRFSWTFKRVPRSSWLPSNVHSLWPITEHRDEYSSAVQEVHAVQRNKMCMTASMRLSTADGTLLVM